MTISILKKLPVICVVSILALSLLCSCSLSKIKPFEKVGSQWVSEDGSISFTIHREYRIWDDGTVEPLRYVAFGSMDTGYKVIDVSCIFLDGYMSMSFAGLSCDYQDILLEKRRIAEFGIESKNENEFTAIVYNSSLSAWQELFGGDISITFTQVESENEIVVSDYEFYVSQYDQNFAATNDTEVHIFDSIEDAAGSQKKVE